MRRSATVDDLGARRGDRLASSARGSGTAGAEDQPRAPAATARSRALAGCSIVGVHRTSLDRRQQLDALALGEPRLVPALRGTTSASTATATPRRSARLAAPARPAERPSRPPAARRARPLTRHLHRDALPPRQPAGAAKRAGEKGCEELGARPHPPASPSTASAVTGGQQDAVAPVRGRPDQARRAHPAR